MTSRVLWLSLAGAGLIGVTFFMSQRLAKIEPAAPAITARTAAVLRRPVYRPPKPLFSDVQFQQFLSDARTAEAIADPLQRCLAYPSPPGLDWSSAATSAYCRYQLDPAVKPEEAFQLIRSGHAAELDRRFAEIMRTPHSQPDQQDVLDRTFNIDFANGSDTVRGLMDAWKRQDPNSPFALAASGMSYLAMAQQARGSDYATNTPQSSFDSMSRLLQRARDDLDAAVKLEPRVTPAYGAMIYVAALSSDTNYAISAARRGLAIEPASYMIYTRLVWMAQPKWGGTVPVMRRFIAGAQRHAKENPLLLVLRAESTGGEQAVEYTPCMPASEYDLYNVLFAQPGRVGLLMEAAWSARHCSRSDLSLIFRSEVLRFDPSNIDHRQMRVSDLVDFGQSQWAMSEGNALVALAPQDENSYEARGLVYESKGQMDDAINDYEQALRINPNDSWDLIELGNLYVSAKHDWDKGWAMANRLLQINPEEPRGWLLRARIQREQPRAGLDQTVSDFITKFGNGPEQQGWIMQMKPPSAPPLAHAVASGHG
jgi:tetratricopeptide (TPR) repeat protein